VAADSDKTVFRVIFYNRGNVYEVYSRKVVSGGLYGFVEVEDLLFGEKSSVVIDPSEERLRSEFQDVRRLYVPMHSVIRIDEVEKSGPGKVRPVGDQEGKVAPFPVGLVRPTPGDGDTGRGG
jgi:hypothetical protein